jgi:SAM-dependent methyltransferase
MKAAQFEKIVEKQLFPQNYRLIMSLPRTIAGTFKRKCISLVRKFRPPTWRQVEHFDEGWKERIRLMAEFIPTDSSVMDLGCGKMWLKQFLNKDTYYGVDYTDRGEGTIICDFNQGEFPTQNAEVAFVSGCLEYIENYNWFINCIGENTKSCVLSYCTLEHFPDKTIRRELAWVNDLTRSELIELFSGIGMTLVGEKVTKTKDSIFHFSK